MSRILRHFVVPAVAALSLAIAPAVAPATASIAAQTINLTENEAPTSGFGKGGTETFGQVFTAPTGFNVLQSFSFWLSDDLTPAANPSELLFQAYVMQWDAANGHATGPVLYSSSVQSGPAAFSVRYDFGATNTSLDGSLQYVAFLSASGHLGNIQTTEALAAMETSLLGTYTGGQFVFTDNDSDFGLLSSDPWNFTGIPEYQSRFSAEFTSGVVSVVPEPSSLALLVTGLAAMLVLAVRRKRV